MIARILTHWASRILASQRKDPRVTYRAKAHDMALKMGRTDLADKLEGFGG